MRLVCERESLLPPVYVATHILVRNNQILRDVNGRRHLILTLRTPGDVNESRGERLSYLRISIVIGFSVVLYTRNEEHWRIVFCHRPVNNKNALKLFFDVR